LLFLFWVQELVALGFTDKKPSHYRLGPRPSPIRESNRNCVGAPIALSRNRIENRYFSSILAEDLDKVMVTADQLEKIRSRRQNTSGNLYRLAESESGGLIPAVCMHYREHDGERKH
jgi:hypothetical protein